MDIKRLPKSGENNLWYRNNNDSDAALVFLHGVLSDSQSCWLYKDKKTNEPICYWPELIDADTRFKNVGIYLAGYYTGVDSGDFPIQQCAENVHSYLKTPDRLGNPCVMEKTKITFICHSMGGIVARSLLCDYRDDFKGKQVGMVLIASPSYGSRFAGKLDKVINLYNNMQGRQLKWGNEVLKDLDRRFKNLKEDTRTFSLSGIELFESRFIFRWKWLPLFARTKIVTEEAAARYFGYAKEIGGSDHSSICKPKTDADPVHQYLLEFLRDKDLLPSQIEFAGPTNAASEPLVRSGLTAAGTPGVFSALSPVQFNLQATQGLVSVPFQTLHPLENGLQPTQLASQLSLILVGQSPSALMQTVQEKPSTEELFEVITDPEVVSRALFRTEQTTGLAPYDVEYVNAREDIPDVQQALETALREARGRLLVCGLGGIGKTREIAELARAACATKWKILVARNEGDLRIGPLLTMPPELIDAKLLIIIDNLHTRIIAGADQPMSPYMERLERLLDWFERRLPGSVRVLATARDEPRFQPYIDLPQDEERWHGFGLFRLPKLTDEGLREILTTLAARASVPVATDDVAGLIENSDRKPATVVINVDLARQKRKTLTQSVWKPTEGESWQLRFVSARADYAGFDWVCQALYLLTDAGLPARSLYVTTVARAFGAQHPEDVVRALVGDGLFKMRQGILTPFSTEQLQELLGQNGESAVKLQEWADTIERAITDPENRPKEWAEDLLALSLGLARADSADRAEQMASRVIERAAGGSRAYRIRAAMRIERRDLTGSEADLTKAIEIGGDEADTHFGRAAIRYLLGNLAGTLEDLDVAMQHGRDDAAVHALRGTAYYMLARWGDADSAMSAAIERGETSGVIFFVRGMVRLFQLNDAAGAEHDLSAALERGIDLEDAANQLRKIQPGPRPSPSSSSSGGLASGNAMVYALRGFARFKLGKSADAEEDLTAAVMGGVGERFRTFTNAMEESTLPILAELKDRLKDSGAFEGSLFHIRGLARLNLDKLPEAEADFDQALTLDFVAGEVYFGRGSARLRMEKFASAEQDAAMALEQGKKDAFTYALRGVARLALKTFPEAEQDFAKAIELDGDNAQFFAWRGAARAEQHKLEDAEADLTAALDHRADARTLFMRGCVRFDLQKYPETEQDLTAALEHGFDQATLFTIRGIARLTQNKITEADEDATIAFERGAADVQAYSLRAAVRLEQERYSEADRDLTAALLLGRNDAWVLFNRGRARQELERYAEAEQDYDATIALGKEAAISMGILAANVFVDRGRTRLAQQKWPEAEQDFSAAIGAGRDDAFVHLSVGRALQEQKRYLQAETEFDLAIARDSHPVYRVVRGYLRLIRGNFRGAEDDFDEMIARETADANALHARGLSRYAQRKDTEALADYDAALTLLPNEAGFLGSCTVAHLRLGNFDEAAKDCVQLEAIDHEGADTEGCSGVLQLARGDFEGALTRLTTAGLRDSSWCYWQGLALLMVGRLEDAREAYRKASAESTPGDILINLDELDIYLRRHPTQAASPEIQSAVALIQTQLRRQVDALSGQGTSI